MLAMEFCGGGEGAEEIIMEQERERSMSSGCKQSSRSKKR
jgi:hypothetical protein